MSKPSVLLLPAVLLCKYLAAQLQPVDSIFLTTIFTEFSEGHRQLLVRFKNGVCLSLAQQGQWFALFGWEKNVRFPDTEAQKPALSVRLKREIRMISGSPYSYRHIFTPSLETADYLSPYLREVSIQLKKIFREINQNAVFSFEIISGYSSGWPLIDIFDGIRQAHAMLDGLQPFRRKRIGAKRTSASVSSPVPLANVLTTAVSMGEGNGTQTIESIFKTIMR